MKVSECQGCHGCPLMVKQPDALFCAPRLGTGTRLTIGEFPYEPLSDEPFSGGASRWFDSMCRKAGIPREMLTLANVIQCHPPGAIFPTERDARRFLTEEEGQAAVKHCMDHHLLPLLRGRPWTRVDLLGDIPLRFVAGKQGIYKWRGAPLKLDLTGRDEYLAIATLHPAHIAKDQLMYPVVVNDLCKGTTVPPEHYNLYPSIADVRAFTTKEFAFDIETDGWNTDVIRCVGLSDGPTRAMVVPFHGQYIDELKRIFREATDVIGHNACQFDLPHLRKQGVEITDGVCRVWDTMLMQHLRFPDLPHDLEFVGSQFCNKPAWKHDKAVFELYNARDVDVTMVAYQQLKPLLQAANLLDVYQYISVPMAKICRLMHTTGFKVDPTHIEEVREKLHKQMADLQPALPERLRTHTITKLKQVKAPEGYVDPATGKKRKRMQVEAHEEVHPWRKTAVIEHYLYKELALPVQLDAKKNTVTTGKIALEKLARLCAKEGREADARSLEALRKLRKLNSLETLFCKEEMLDIQRMHPHFNVHGTGSGRLSSSDPNLQNVPEAARFIYVPSHPGWKIIDVDYSQIENRLTAHFAGDTERLQRFINDAGFSEHKYLASMFLNVPYAEVEKSSDPDGPYIRAKKIVHGTNYGEGALKIARLNNLDFKEVKQMQEQWKRAIYKTIQWQDMCATQAKRQGYLANPFNRKRWFWTDSAYTESLSFLPQSTAADIIFRAMIALMYERINWPLEYVQRVVDYIEPLPPEATLLLQVHDSLIFECPAECVDNVVKVVKRVMEQPFKELGGFTIPIGIKVGDSWGEAETWKEGH